MALILVIRSIIILLEMLGIAALIPYRLDQTKYRFPEITIAYGAVTYFAPVYVSPQLRCALLTAHISISVICHTRFMLDLRALGTEPTPTELGERSGSSTLHFATRSTNITGDMGATLATFKEPSQSELGLDLGPSSPTHADLAPRGESVLLSADVERGGEGIVEVSGSPDGVIGHGICAGERPLFSPDVLWQGPEGELYVCGSGGIYASPKC